MNCPESVLPSNRKFGFFFFFIFFLFSVYFFYLENNFWFYFFGVLSLALILVILINVDILLPINKLWFKFGLLLGIVISPIVMGIIFYGIFTPIAIFFRIIGRDELRLKFKKKSTHWIKRNKVNQSEPFKQQF